MRIAICDDEKAQQQLLQKYLEEWAQISGTPLKSELFASAEAFSFTWEEDRDFDLLILDIEMGQQNGMEMAARIRTEDEEIPILFVTGYEKYMAQGYEVAALHYLLKPIRKEKLFSLLDRLKEKNLRQEQRLLFQTEDGPLSLPPSRIWYLEARAHWCVLYTADNEYTLHSPIGELERFLSGQPEFLRCHRSYLVNAGHICAILKTELALDDGRRLPLSRSAQKKVNQAFIALHEDSVFRRAPR